MKTLVLGGDGFCGWPTSLHLSNIGHEVIIVDNLSRRNIDNELEAGSLTPISTMGKRLEAWRELTGLPFVYAMWMCRAEMADSPPIGVAAAALDRQRRHNAMRLDWIAARRGPEHGWPADLAATYLGAMLRYGVGERERAAVEAFFDAAAEEGVTATRRSTNWVDM